MVPSTYAHAPPKEMWSMAVNVHHARRYSTLQGIQDRIIDGVKEHSPHMMHGAGGLAEVIRCKDALIDSFHLRHLNDAHHLTTIEGALDTSKQILMVAANAPRDIKRFSIALRNRFTRKIGLHVMLEMTVKMVKKTYSPKNFGEEDDAQGELLLLLRGRCVADIVHRVFGTPALSTIRQRHSMPRLLLSHSKPTIAEIEQNIDACFESLVGVLPPSGVLNTVLMYDEVANEKRSRYDDETNWIVGGSREDGVAASMEFRSMQGLEMFMEDVEVRLASEVHTCSATSPLWQLFVPPFTRYCQINTILYW